MLETELQKVPKIQQILLHIRTTVSSKENKAKGKEEAHSLKVTKFWKDNYTEEIKMHDYAKKKRSTKSRPQFNGVQMQNTR